MSRLRSTRTGGGWSFYLARRTGTGTLTYDEHCQRLSVTVPADARPGDALPVMVWIHGGSYTSGAGDAPIFDPAALVREQHVVVVSVTYRLGLLGYLGDADGRPANLGLLDQLEALRWVSRSQRQIARVLGVAPGTVKSRTARAAAALARDDSLRDLLAAVSEEDR